MIRCLYDRLSILESSLFVTSPTSRTMRLTVWFVITEISISSTECLNLNILANIWLFDFFVEGKIQKKVGRIHVSKHTRKSGKQTEIEIKMHHL